MFAGTGRICCYCLSRTLSFSACWMGTPPQCLWLAVAPESALPHSRIPTLAQHPTSHRPNIGPVHMTCGVLTTCSGGTFCYLLGV